MKNIKNTITILAAMVLTFTTFSNPLFAQDETENKKAETIEEHLRNQSFVFVADVAFPMQGRNIQLTGRYDLSVSGDTLKSYLPYFGRAYSAPINPADGGYMFSSVGINYNVTDKKKGSWQIEIEPTDRHKGEKFILSAYPNGTATLQITSINRQPITFRGYIPEQQEKN